MKRKQTLWGRILSVIIGLEFSMAAMGQTSGDTLPTEDPFGEYGPVESPPVESPPASGGEYEYRYPEAPPPEDEEQTPASVGDGVAAVTAETTDTNMPRGLTVGPSLGYWMSQPFSRYHLSRSGTTSVGEPARYDRQDPGFGSAFGFGLRVGLSPDNGQQWIGRYQFQRLPEIRTVSEGDGDFFGDTHNEGRVDHQSFGMGIGWMMPTGWSFFQWGGTLGFSVDHSRQTGTETRTSYQNGARSTRNLFNSQLMTLGPRLDMEAGMRWERWDWRLGYAVVFPLVLLHHRLEASADGTDWKQLLQHHSQVGQELTMTVLMHLP